MEISEPHKFFGWIVERFDEITSPARKNALLSSTSRLTHSSGHRLCMSRLNIILEARMDQKGLLLVLIYQKMIVMVLLMQLPTVL